MSRRPTRSATVRLRWTGTRPAWRRFLALSCRSCPGSTRRQLAWGRLPGHFGLALLIALACASPYLPALLHWAGSGAAYQVGLDEGAAMQAGAASAGAVQQLEVLTLDALGVDLPVRVIL